MPISLDFDRRLYARIAREAPPSWLTRCREWLGGISWKPALPAAALVATWILLVAPLTPPPAEVQDRVETQQMAHTLEDLDMLQQIDL